MLPLFGRLGILLRVNGVKGLGESVSHLVLYVVKDMGKRFLCPGVVPLT